MRHIKTRVVKQWDMVYLKNYLFIIKNKIEFLMQ